jgi:drug/metabolite transporter (DMT)-like permease
VIRYLPSLAMLGAVFLWASSATGNKWALADVTVPEVVAYRIVGGALILWCAGLALRRSYRWRGPWPLLMGILEPGLVTFFIVLGLKYTSAVNAAVVWGIMPATQPVLARLILKEPIQRSVLVGAALAIAGTALLFAVKHEDGTGSLLGDFLLVCGVASASANQMIARRIATTHREPIVTTSYQLLSSSLLALVYLAFFVPPAGLYATADAVTYAVLTFLILTTAGPFFLYNYALQYMSVGRVSLFAPLTGPIGVVMATLAFGEPIDALIVAAILMALGGAFLPALARSRGGE